MWSINYFCSRDLKELMSKSSLTYENILKNCDAQQVNKRYQESKVRFHLIGVFFVYNLFNIRVIDDFFLLVDRK